MGRAIPCLAALALSLGCGSQVTIQFDDGPEGGGGGGGAGGPPTCEAACDAIDDACIDGSCVDGSCVAEPRPDGTACDDGIFCTVGDSCRAGVCDPTGARDCPAPGPCEIGYCEETFAQCLSMPANDGAACDDGDPCTGDGSCSVGACQPGAGACDALDGPCHDGVCTAMGCVALVKPEGSLCNDGNACTFVDTCGAGVCVGTGGPLTYFSDDFANSAAGWTLGSEWQIGPAAQSMGQSIGSPDPAMDHSPSADNGIAGAVIGGNPPVMMPHDFYWLESPSFDATIDPGPVILSFYRWLNSDYEPFVEDRIEVWDGMQWVGVWDNGFDLHQDSSWTQVTHDLSAYKNAAMRVRFGHNVGLSGAFLMSGWNIDDVVVATASCP